MYSYTAYNMGVISSIPLQGLDSGNGDEDLLIVRDEVLLPSSDIIIKGKNYGVTKEAVYLFWDKIGSFEIREGRLIVVDPHPGLDEKYLTPYILGSAMAVILNQRGFLVLHASSVEINGGAVAFMGWTGYGKSTTAMALHNKGHPLVTDDILAVNVDKKGLPIVSPAFPRIKLSKDFFNSIKKGVFELTPEDNLVNGKKFFPLTYGFSKNPLMLKQIYVLKKSTKTMVSNLEAQNALIELVRHSYCNSIFQKWEQSVNLVQCSNLIRKIPVKSLEVDRSIQSLHRLAEVVEDDIDSEDKGMNEV